MATVHECETVAELLDALGVPPERVRLKPQPGTATEQDVLDIWERQKRICELVEGTLVERASGGRDDELTFPGVLEGFAVRIGRFFE